MRVLTDREFMAEWFGFFGVTKGVSALGWCVASAIGAPVDADRRWMLGHGFGSQSTRYKRVRELLEFREYLAAKGVSLGETDERVTATWKAVAQ